jgi:hypothetical protein
MTTQTRLLVFITSVFILISCRTTTHENSQNRTYSVSSIDKYSKNLIAQNNFSGCEQLEYRCTEPKRKNPTLCSLSKYEGGLLSSYQIIQGWGNDLCTAKHALNIEVCKQNKDPTKIGRITCIPDPSDGECPTKDLLCPDSKAPAVCQARRYNKSLLHWEQSLKGWGFNECKAKENLLKQACKSNLKPSLLGHIFCEEDYTKGKCPITQEVCSETPKEAVPHTCHAEKYGETTLSEPFFTYGLTLCEAKTALYELACLYANSQNRLNPSHLTDIKCEPEPR